MTPRPTDLLLLVAMLVALALAVALATGLLIGCSRPVPTTEPERRETPWCFRWLRGDVVETYCTEAAPICEEVQRAAIEHGRRVGVRAVGSCRDEGSRR